ncbi:hypothetical protein LOC54_09440 [Acetobacter sp. AN02]|uniref:hypothetical protein n=1 Tax=Acetobacter sp. AN02 TaxID=2894186 RepID=UPI0024344E0B|nr:hypothetical protein [Acetobacter sp. AN02]MDG6095323.1 hypothetical protein [Acetobacter sp. AN02]
MQFSSLPALPLWAQSALLALMLMFALLFLFMPFAVYGVKSRLREMELRLEEIRAELRVITSRLGGLEPPARTEWTPPPAPERPSPEFRAPGAPVRPVAATAPKPVDPVPAAPDPVQPPQAAPRSEEKAAPRTEQEGQPASAGTSPLAASPLRAARVTDAYEPHDTTPPEPVSPAAAVPRAASRMPWHTMRQDVREEPSVSFPEKKNSSTERPEPVLRWPGRHDRDNGPQ